MADNFQRTATPLTESMLFRLTFDQSPAFMCVLQGPNHTFEAANANYQKIVGNRALVGKTLEESLPEIKGTQFPKLLDQVYQSGEAIFRRETQVFLQQNKTGPLTELYLDFTYQPLKNADGVVTGIFVHGVDVTAQVLARKTIEAERENIRELFQQAGNIFAKMKGPDHVFEYVNPAHVALLGKDVTGLSVRIAQPEAKPSGAFELLDKVYRTGVAHIDRERAIRVGMKTHYFDFIYAATKDAQGNVDGINALVSDVTETVLARESVQNQNLWLEEVLNRLPIGLIMSEPDSAKYRFTNNEARLMLGQAPNGAWLDLSPDKLIVRDTEGRTLSLDEIPSARASRGEELVNEVIILDKGDSRIFVSCSSSVIPAMAGHAKTVLVPFLNVTDLKTKEIELIHNIKKLDTIVHDLTEGLIFADEHGNIQLMNPAALRIHGFKTKEAVTKELYKSDGDKLPPSDWPLTRVLKGERFSDYEIEVRRGDQSTIVSYGGTPIHDDKGKLILAVLSLRDVTSKKRTELELKNAVRARDEFLSLASHELKTPLTSLKLQTQMFKRGVKKGDAEAYSKERVDKLTAQTEKQLIRFERLIDDMLDISRIRSGKLTLQPEKIDLLELTRELLQRMEHQFTDADLPAPQLIFQQSPQGFWDRLRIEQVMTNLLTNAIRYGRGSQIKVGIEGTEKTARFWVQDHGIGIAKENLKKIFGRFERVTSASEASGLGLGLFIAHQIVKAHGGKLSVKSEIGQGSIFTAELPLG
jgi:PAS domain S-box-containing protein